jgi:hypothetical protein
MRRPDRRNGPAYGTSPLARAIRRIAAINSLRSSVTSQASIRPGGAAPGPPSSTTRTPACAISSPAGA